MECDSLLLLLSPCFWFLNLFRVMPEGWPLSAYNQGFFHTPTELNPFCQKGTMHNFSWSRDLGLHGCSEGWHNAFLFQHNSRKELVHNLQWHLWPCLRLDLKKVDASKKNGNLKVQTDTAVVSLQHQTGHLSANWSQVEGQNMLPSLADPQHSNQRQKRLTQKKTITNWPSSGQLVKLPSRDVGPLNHSGDSLQ
jgi:hypothetical protein